MSEEHLTNRQDREESDSQGSADVQPQSADMPFDSRLSSLQNLDKAVLPSDNSGKQVSSWQDKDQESRTNTEPPYIVARDLSMKTLRGYVYKDVTVTAYPGNVVAVRGHHHSGKTALLLTLAGRMKQTSGTLQVGGFHLPKQRSKVMRHVGLGLFKGLNDLHKSLSVGQIVASELEFVGRKPDKAHVKRYLDEWKLNDIVRMRVQDLNAQRLVLLCTALAFCSDPGLVVIDDIESQLTLRESQEVMKKIVTKAHELNTCIALGVVESSLADMADIRVDLLTKEERDGI